MELRSVMEVIRVAFEVHVDPEVCTGSASCVRWEPTVFGLDADGLAMVIDSEGAAEAAIVTVAQACPSGAIVVTRDGELLAG